MVTHNTQVSGFIDLPLRRYHMVSDRFVYLIKVSKWYNTIALFKHKWEKGERELKF